MKRHQTPSKNPHAIWATCQASSFSIRPPHWAPRTSSLATAGPINKRSSLQPARDGPGGAQEASSSSATRSSHDYDPSSATSLLSRWTLTKTWRRRRRYPRNYPRLTLDFLSSSVFVFSRLNPIPRWSDFLKVGHFCVLKVEECLKPLCGVLPSCDSRPN